MIFFYLANELLSVIENAGKMGLPMPNILRNAVHIFESKSTPPENPMLIDEAQPEAVKETKEIKENQEQQKCQMDHHSKEESGDAGEKHA